MDLGTLLIVASAVAAAIMAGGIADVIRLGSERFATVGKRRCHWVLLIILFGPLAVLLYAGAVRPQLLHPERYADESAEVSSAPVLGGILEAGDGRPR